MNNSVPKHVTSQSIRMAELSDANDILDIYNDSIKTGYSTGHVAPIGRHEVMDWLTFMTPERPFLVFELDHRVVAWANADDFHGLPVFSNCAEIGVYVLPAFQRQGIAQGLLQELESVLRAQGTSHLVALIFQTNQASLDLFHKFEFQAWGLLPKVAKSDGKKQDIHLLGKII